MYYVVGFGVEGVLNFGLMFIFQIVGENVYQFGVGEQGQYYGSDQKSIVLVGVDYG